MKNFINRCLNEGAQIIDSRTLSDCPIPSMHRPWEVGCYLRIPDNPTVMRDANFGLFIPITVTFADGLSTVDKLFLTTFTKSHQLKERFVFAHGSASKFVQQFTNWNEAVKALAGKTIEVNSITNCEVLDPRGLTRNSRIYGLELR